MVLFPCDTESDSSAFSAWEDLVTVGFAVNTKRAVCTDVLGCLCCLCLCLLSKCLWRFLPTSEFYFRFSVFFLLLLSSSCFNVLSTTFTSWIVALYLLCDLSTILLKNWGVRTCANSMYDVCVPVCYVYICVWLNLDIRIYMCLYCITVDLFLYLELDFVK